MGLDIYLRKGKRNLANPYEISKSYEYFSNEKVEQYKGMLAKWQKSMNMNRFKTNQSAVDALYKLVKKYDASFYSFSEWDGEKWVSTLDIEKGKDYVEKVLSGKEVFSSSDMYYRKVNFLYAFFEPTQDEMAFVEKYDAERLVDACNKVIEAYNGNADWESVAKEELPTQSGFFFGSTDYDDWYLANVRQARREFKQFLKNWQPDEVAIICYSW